MKTPFVSRRALVAGCLSLGMIAAGLLPAPASAARITVFAAASLKNALGEIARDWKADSGNEAAISFAGSSLLARQIIAGAPADLYISADIKWMDAVARAGRIAPQSRVDLLGNSLVLIAPRASAAPVHVAKGFDLLGKLGSGRLAMALYDSVPAGIYGREALTALGVWTVLKGHVAQADNVRAALALVATGEAPYGIVYATDAAAEPRVSVVGTFPADSHPPIIYPAALMKGASPAARAFMAYLEGPRARAVFERDGFRVLVK